MLLEAQDVVTVRVTQSSGAPLDIGKEGEASPEFAMTWLAPGP